MLENTENFTGERYEVGVLWSYSEPYLPDYYRSAMGQLYQGRKPEEFGSTVNRFRFRCRKGIREGIERVQGGGHFWERMVFATPSSTKPEQDF